RCEFQPVVGLEINAQTANNICRPLDADEMIKNFRRRDYVVDKNEGARSISADIEADRGPLPIDFLDLPSLQVKGALAIPTSADEGCGCLLANDVAARPARFMKDIFDRLGYTFGGVAEESVPGLDHFLQRVGGIGRLLLHLPVAGVRDDKRQRNEAEKGGREA